MFGRTWLPFGRIVTNDPQQLQGSLNSLRCSPRINYAMHLSTCTQLIVRLLYKLLSIPLPFSGEVELSGCTITIDRNLYRNTATFYDSLHVSIKWANSSWIITVHAWQLIMWLKVHSHMIPFHSERKHALFSSSPLNSFLFSLNLFKTYHCYNLQIVVRVLYS